ncbi:MAG: T9SS type A sorting domain-containing protein [candidate division WOR-3 bacterium]|nr:T9SS type A sorting domain-containing protein [candidate division WOR-3 bacterium]
MSKFIITLSIIAFGLVLAAEYPTTQSQTQATLKLPAIAEQVQTKRPVEYTYKPFWSVLEVLTSEERANAEIEIILDVTESSEAHNFAKHIEQLWNNHQYDEALSKFSELEGMINPMDATVGISWRKPIPSPELGDNPYVQIGTRDSIYVVAFDVDYSNDNYFCVLGLEGDRTGGGSRFSVNMSTDGGNNWSETYALGGYDYKMNDIGGEVSGRHFWVSYTGGSSNRTLWLQRYKTLDGEQDTFQNGNTSFAAFIAPTTDTIRELEITSNQTFQSNRVYLFCMMYSDSLRWFWDDTGAMSWTAAHPTYANAKNGLDACWNEGFASGDTQGLFMSYVGTNDTVNILRRTNNWYRYYRYYIGPCSEEAEKTTIGAYRDTVCCAFLLEGGRVRYLIKYGPNPTWYYGDVPQDTSPGILNYTADLTCRGNYIHLVYRAPGNQGVYTYRHYYQFAPWSIPQRYDEATYVHAWVRPEIQWIGTGDDVGIVWVTYPPGLQKAYFTKTPFPGIAENSEITISKSRLKSHWVPGGVNIQYNLTSSGPVTIKVYDITGKLITAENEIKHAGIHNWFWSAKTSGIYFVKINANGNIGTVKVAITK